MELLDTVLSLFLLICSAQCVTKNKCVPRDFGNGSPVCVCSGSYCDTVAPVEPLNDGYAAIFTSSKGGLRFTRDTAEFSATLSADEANLTVDTSIQFQKILGFGGAFTDASGINIASLPRLAQDYLMLSYFGDGGIGYSIGRIPIASCDFSTRNYSYDDVADDFDLEHFSLVDEDLTKKIPFIKQAMYMSKTPIKLFGSPWSAPYWLKTNNMMQGNGTIIGNPGEKYYQTWANYFVKYRRVNVWGLTAQNEPTTGFIYDYAWQTMGFTPELQRDFIKLDLGPALQNSSYKNVSIMILDDQRYMLPLWAQVVLNDSDAAKFVSHIAVHWYADKWNPLQILNETHYQFPNVPLLGTEACVVGGVVLGSWERGESYARDIIHTLNNWYTGWTDWNIALDLQGGPNWVGNFVDSPIIVNASSGEFYKQPMFYAMGHFSAFLPRDSVRIGLTTNIKKLNKDGLFATAFQSSAGYKVVIVLNHDIQSMKITIADKLSGSVLPLTVPAQSIQTILWK